MKKFLLYIFLTALVVPGCRKMLFDDEIEKREFTLGEFSAVTIEGIYDVVLVQDSANRLIVSGNSNIASIKVRTENDTLFIENRTFSIEPSRSKLELHFTSMTYLWTGHPVSITNEDTLKANSFTYVAIGEIEEVSLNVDCDYLVIYGGHNTLGDFRISGRSTFADLSVRYGASMDAGHLECIDAEIFSSSAGDVYVNASNKIKASIKGPGNVYYFGNPAVNLVERTGEGRMIPLQ